MKKFITLLVALIAIFAVDAKPKQNTELAIRIGSYNIWSHAARRGQVENGNANEARSWDNSKRSVAELIVKLNCDILGMQEVTSLCRDDLAQLVKSAGGKKYALWWVDTYPESGKKHVGNAVFYNKKRFKLSNENIYYFSPTPEVMSKGWDEKKYYRASLTATVTHKKSGKKFFLIATHGPLKKIASENAGRILVEIDKKYNTEGLPTIVVGDMNACPGEGFHTTMCTYYEDAYLVANRKCGTIGTFNGSSGYDNNLKLTKRRIDHIYVHSTDKGKCTVKNYEVNCDKYEIMGTKHYPSDHNPVVAEITIK